MKVVSFGFVLFVLLLEGVWSQAASTNCTNASTKGILRGQCGPANQNATCKDPTHCCSEWGWCGSGEDFCNERTQCQPSSTCTSPERAASTPQARCGRDFMGAPCADPNHCCSQYGWCGSTDEYCTDSPQCPAREPTPKPTLFQTAAMHRPEDPKPTVRRRIKHVVPLPVRSPVRALSSCGKGRKLAVLSFDDGPDENNGYVLLREMEKVNVTSTYFLSPAANGEDPDELEQRCELVREMVAKGHDVQMHSWSHPMFPTLSPKEVKYQIRHTAKWLRGCGQPNPTMFRPPYGQLLPEQVSRISQNMGYIIGMWNVEPSDFEMGTEDEIFQRVVESSKRIIQRGDSAVILLHEYVVADRKRLLRKIVNYYRTEDYQFVTMNECYATCDSPICAGRTGPTPTENVYVPVMT